MDDLELICNLMFSRSIATGHAMTIAEAAQTFAEAYDEQRAELARLRAENERLAHQLKVQEDYATSRLCNGHIGHWQRGRCVLCEIEMLRGRLADIARAALTPE